MKSNLSNYRKYRQPRLITESLEEKLPLDASGFVGNECAPDLDFANLNIPTIEINQELTLNLFDAGATVTDENADGSATNDTIRLQLDPDDGPSNATLTDDGDFRWTPTADQVGRFEFVVIAVDEGDPPLADAEVFVVIVGDNQAPDLADIADVSLDPNESLETNISATDANGDTLTFSLDPDQSPDGLTLEQLDNNNAVLRWTPGAMQPGSSVSVSVLVTDDGVPAMSDNEVFVVRFNSVTSTDDAYSVDEGQTLTVTANDGVLSNDSDAEGDSLVATLVDLPQDGTVSFQNDGSFEYTPDSGFQGTDSFTYRAADGSGDESIATVTITVDDVATNIVAIANNESYTTSEDATLTVDVATGVLANDTGVIDTPLTATVTVAPTNGALTLNSDGSFEFIPDSGFVGVAEFTYAVSNGPTSSLAVASINVQAANDAPETQADAYSTTEEQTLTIDVAAGLLANDSDPDNDSLTVVVEQLPANGTLTLSEDGSFVYTPNDGFSGTDQFSYTASDGDASSNATSVSIDVAAVNDAPITQADAYSTAEDQTLTIDATAGVLANDSDADNDSLTVSVAQQPANGTLVLDADGSFVYTPDADFNGTDQFSYTVSDGEASSEATDVSIDVTSVNDAPVGAVRTFNATEATLLTVFAAEGLLVDATDVENDSLTTTLVSGASNGIVALNSDGSFSYTGNADFVGEDSFEFMVNDGTDDSSVLQVTIVVAEDTSDNSTDPPAENTPPVGVGDSYSAQEDEVLRVDAASGVLANDTDADGDDLTAILVGEPGQGTLVFNSDGSFEYTPNQTSSGLDGFSYRVTDGEAESIELLVAFLVTPSNDAPDAVADEYDATAGIELSIDAAAGLLANDSDIENESLTAAVVDEPANGTLTLLEDGSFTYTANDGFTGTDTFTYRASDGVDDSELTTVTISVAADEGSGEPPLEDTIDDALASEEDWLT